MQACLEICARGSQRTFPKAACPLMRSRRRCLWSSRWVLVLVPGDTDDPGRGTRRAEKMPGSSVQRREQRSNQVATHIALNFMQRN